MKSSKSNAKNVTGAPEGYHTLTPFIVVKDAAQLLDFMSSAFGAVELNRMADGDGAISHAETKVAIRL